MRKILKDPLVHFLALGLGLFILFDLVASDDAAYDSRVINVDRDALLTFVQYRSRAFEPRVAAARLDRMSDEELERLISDYVREEALHREAKALGVDQNDYIIKRRMIQSIEFITDGFVTAAVDVSDDDIAAHYEANREDYYINPFVTFTHVFFDAERHGRDETLALATAKLGMLNSQQVPFSDAPRHGDRFPFFVNYVERDPQCNKPVGNTVNVADASHTNTVGDPMLTAYWKDPDFNPKQKAFYYVRVIEIPKPRWTAYDAKFFEVKMPKEVPMVVQDRAYTSPIWYAPEKDA